MATVERVLTIEEYVLMPDDGRRTELVRGRIVEVPPTNYWHGLVCVEIAVALRVWVKANKLGRVISNNLGIITQRDPDSVRGADVAYYSYARIPSGSHPAKYPDLPPEIVIEVRSPSDRWKEIREKVAEYLAIGVLIVCVIDPDLRTAWIDYPDQPDRMIGPDGEITFPECLPDFSVPMPSLFE